MQNHTPPLIDRPLFFLDYDGTLAPIVEDPMQAYPHEDARDLLVRLNATYPVWIVTGRHLRDLTPLLGLPLRAVGLHGAQEGVVGGRVESRVPEAVRADVARMRATLPEVEGLRVEDKEHTFAVHFRAVADEALVRERLSAWAAGLPPTLDAVWGKKVLELRPRGIDKGVAVRRIAEAHPGRTPLYLGDDVTDEDAFEALGEAGFSIKVGEGETRARYRLPDVEAVIRYLEQYP